MTQSASATRAEEMGGPDGVLTEDEIRTFVRDRLDATDLDGRSLCVLVPDSTRSVPLALLMSAVHGAVHGRVTKLNVLVALGTHERRRMPLIRSHAAASQLARFLRPRLHGHLHSRANGCCRFGRPTRRSPG